MSPEIHPEHLSFGQPAILLSDIPRGGDHYRTNTSPWNLTPAVGYCKILAFREHLLPIVTAKVWIFKRFSATRNIISLFDFWNFKWYSVASALKTQKKELQKRALFVCKCKHKLFLKNVPANRYHRYLFVFRIYCICESNPCVRYVCYVLFRDFFSQF